MTNLQRTAAIAAADLLRIKLAEDRHALEAVRVAARALASAIDSMDCCLANTVSAARKVQEAPTADTMRELAENERHLDRYARRTVRKARRALLGALPEVESALALVTPPELAQPEIK